MDPLEIALIILQALTIFFFIMIPYLILIIVMSFEIRDSLWKILKSFLLLILPWIVILIGIVVGVENFNINILDLQAVWYYAIPITWFGSGLIFFMALK
jgi:hypothetical protein